MNGSSHLFPCAPSAATLPLCRTSSFTRTLAIVGTTEVDLQHLSPNVQSRIFKPVHMLIGKPVIRRILSRRAALSGARSTLKTDLAMTFWNESLEPFPPELFLLFAPSTSSFTRRILPRWANFFVKHSAPNGGGSGFGGRAYGVFLDGVPPAFCTFIQVFSRNKTYPPRSLLGGQARAKKWSQSDFLCAWSVGFLTNFWSGFVSLGGWDCRLGFVCWSGLGCLHLR